MKPLIPNWLKQDDTKRSSNFWK